MESIEQTLAFITERFDEKGRELIKRSFDFACSAHEGQKRMSGEPYITHTVQVARILTELQMDSVTVSAGLLHDVIEDTHHTIEDIKKVADENVAFLVEGVSQVTAKVFKTKGEIFSESLKKMFVAMAKDIRVIIIKLADRLHNMRTIQYLPPERQKITAHETLNVYAPLAHRIGMSRIKQELEDISFSILNPEDYAKIEALVAEHRGERERFIEETKEQIRAELEKEHIKAEITGRPKHYYSIHLKMVREAKAIDDIYDLMGLRVITQNVSSCYSVLGHIHNMWTPMPGRFKDYIAMPKSNMYQSLHTTVVTGSGKTVEIQIRTAEMNKIAEEGIAAHWNYKENKEFDKDYDTAFAWIRQILEWQSTMKESDEFIKELKLDLFDEEVFVFTPKGEVKEFVKGATILDFAYSIHSDLGSKCSGAKVNGKWVTFKYELKNGDIVEIQTSATQHPSIDWLKIVKTAKAKNRIRHWLHTSQDSEENKAKGKQLLSGALLKLGLDLDAVPKEALGKVLEGYSLKTPEDLFAGIGYGEFSDSKAATMIRRAIGEKKEEAPKKADVAEVIKKGEIVVEGKHSDISYRLARCCNPVPGDTITGILTKKGLSIHRMNCVNITSNKITTPLVSVSWGEGIQNYFLCRFRISAKFRDALINDVMTTINDNKAFATSVNSGVIRGVYVVDIAVKVKGQQHVQELVASLRKIKDVDAVDRADI